MDVAKEWWLDFFLSGQYRLDEHVGDPERAAREVDFIEEKLALEPGSAVLDLCCGIGRHSNEFAWRGYRVTGVDFTPSALQAARCGTASFVRGDMRCIPLRGRFDGAFNVFTSFGYFEDEEHHQMVLNEVGRLLRPGGRFVLDVMNPYWLARNFKGRLWSELPDGFVLEEGQLDFVRGRIATDWTFVRGAERRTFPTSIRLFTVPELERMMDQTGLRLMEAYGNLRGEPMSLEVSRQVLVAEKAG